MKIGVLGYRYGYYQVARNIVSHGPEVEYVKIRDAFSIVNVLSRRLNSYAHKSVIPTFNLNNQFYDANLNKIDRVHLLNGISYGHTPWVSTFETLLPRLDYVLQNHRKVAHLQDIPKHHTWLRVSFEALAGDSCRRLIAQSGTAAKMQRGILSKYPEYEQDILKKITVLHPPQPTDLEFFTEKKIDVDGPIRFMLVGAHFFRKGGVEIAETFIKLRRDYGYPIEFIVVSSLDINDYVAPRSSADIQHVLQLFKENSDWISHYQTLPNDEVLAMMKTAHVGFLPTYADSYGYSVLEFQAMGCPVITTDIRALPEINNDKIGWLIKVPKDDWGEGLYDSEDERKVMGDQIRSGIEQSIHAIFKDRSSIQRKSDLVLARIRDEHSPQKFSQALREIYEI